MKMHVLSLCLAASLFGSIPMIGGCERTISEDKTVKTNSDGSQTTDSKTVTQEPNGDIVKQQSHTNTPANPNP